MADITPEQKADSYMNSVDKGYNAFIVGNRNIGDEALRNFQAFLNQERMSNPQAYVKELRELTHDTRFSVHKGGANNQDLVLEFDSPYGQRNGTP